MKFIITGGKPLHGEITLSGAKNAATKMMVASLLTEEPCTFTNFPFIGDTAITGELCEQIGSIITKNETAQSILIHTPNIKNNKALRLSRRNRIPILALGPLLARTGEAEVPVLGGDKIGLRPVDLHFYALRLLGAEIEVTSESYRARAPRGLRGATIRFASPSVGATENALLASVCASGNTVLKNTAMEPEIIELIKMLQKMGAVIEFGSDRTMYIEGVSKLRGVTHRVIPDRNEAVSFGCLALATDGEILVREASQDYLMTFLNTVRRIGGDYEVRDRGIVFKRAERILRPVRIECASHPGFMTDWQQPLAVLLTQANGTSEIHETIYEDRLGYVNELNALGARMERFNDCGTYYVCRFANQGFMHRAVIRGGTPLHGGALTIHDLRAGIAHMIAALVAHGESIIDGVHELDRGYERIDERLRAIGADIKRV